MTPHLEKRLAEIAAEKGYHPASEYMDALRTGAVEALDSRMAPKHTGMMISARGLLMRVGGYLKPGARQLLEHLKEVADRFYAGDISAVDEFLQLYQLDEARPKEPSDA